MRYARQPYWYSCGPTAIINSVKWAGAKFSLKENHTFVARLCNSCYEFGTEEKNISFALRTMMPDTAKIRKQNKPLFKDVMKHLKQPNCALVMLYWRQGPLYKLDKDDFVGHYTLLNLEGDDLISINDKRSETKTHISKSELVRRLSFRRKSKEYFPQVWFLRKK